MDYTAEKWDIYWARPYSNYELHQQWFWDHCYAYLEGKILDIGCGPASMWKETDYDVTGYDYSPQAIQEAQKNYPAGKFKVADLASIKPSPDYDCVVSCGVAHYFEEDLDTYLKAVFGSSKKWVIITLNRDWDLAPFRKYGDLKAAYFKDRVGWVLVFRVLYFK